MAGKLALLNTLAKSPMESLHHRTKSVVRMLDRVRVFGADGKEQRQAKE